jgi:putative transcriptional regulator
MFRLRLKEVLKEKGISQGQLSRGANVALQTVSRMANDPNYVPNSDTLFKIAKFLDVPVDQIYVEVPDDEANPPPQA